MGTIAIVELPIHDDLELGHIAFLITPDDMGNGAGRHMLVVMPCRDPNRNGCVLNIESRNTADGDRDIFDPLAESDQDARHDPGIDDLTLHVRPPAGC
jgi:hypothetical protein